MTRIPGTVWTPATYDPQYFLGKAFPRSLKDIWFTVNHDARGFRSFLRQGQAPGREAGWLITNLIDGTRLQHYELEAATWTSGGHWNNLHGVATEHENLKGAWGFPTFEVITPAQVEADLETELFLATVCPNLRPPTFTQGRREHRELTNGATSCPNGRIQPLYDYEEDDVAITEAEFRRIREETWSVMLELLRLGTTGDKDVPMKQWSDKVLSELKDIKAKLDAPGHH